MNRLLPLYSLIVCGACLASIAAASQVHLEVSMSHPTLLADKKQTTFLKVGLTGFGLPQSEQRPPVNVAIVLDKSGSMSGEKMEQAKHAAMTVVERLEENDIVSLIVYDTNVEVVVPATKLTDKSWVIQRIVAIRARGSTALYAGVSQGAQEIQKFIEKERVNRIVLLSDGLANVGPRTPSELSQLGRTLMEQGITVSTLGLGLDYNEDLMTQLAQSSGGNHAFIEHANDLVHIFNQEFDTLTSVVAQEVLITINVAEGIRPVRVMNRDADINGKQVVVNLNQLLSEQERYVLLEVEVPACPAGMEIVVAEVLISYANLVDKTQDQLKSSVGANFSDSAAVVEQNANVEVCTSSVLQLANEKNILATTLRDEGHITEAKQVLLENSKYLRRNAVKYDSDQLWRRSEDNTEQAAKIDGREWKKFRKVMRQQQNADAVQQAYDGKSQ